MENKGNTGLYDNILAVIAWAVAIYFFYDGEPTAGVGMFILGKLYADSTNTAIYRRRKNETKKSGSKPVAKAPFGAFFGFRCGV